VPGYVLPDYTGSGMTEPTLLMAAAPAMTALAQSDQLRSLVRAIYMDRYCLPPGHPLVSRALASIAPEPARSVRRRIVAARRSAGPASHLPHEDRTGLD